MNSHPDFKSYLLDQGLSDLTISSYERNTILFGQWFYKSNGFALKPNKLTPIDIREYKQYLLVIKQRSPATINQHLAAIHAYAMFAIANKLIKYDPTLNIKGIAQVDQAPRWLDKLQLFKLERQLEESVLNARTPFAKHKSIRELAIFQVILNTGMRISELCDLQVSDIEISDRLGEVTVRNGKGNKQRTIPLNNNARKAIRAWLEIRKPGDNLFWIKPRAIERFMRELSRIVQVEVTPHQLRHSFAKLLINANVSIEKVAMLLGHNRLDTTRRYITPGKEDLEKAVGELDL